MSCCKHKPVKCKQSFTQNDLIFFTQKGIPPVPCTVDLQIEKLCPPSPIAEDTTIDYIITYQNNSNCTATDVTITDTISVSPGVVLSVVSNGGANPAPAPGTKINFGRPGVFVFSGITLAPGQSGSQTISVHVDNVPASAGPHTITNTATITSFQPESNPSDNTASCTTTVIKNPAP